MGILRYESWKKLFCCGSEDLENGNTMGSVILIENNKNSYERIFVNNISDDGCSERMDSHKPTVVLDLDGTLIYASLKRKDDCDFNIIIGPEKKRFFVSIRPFLDEFLEILSAHYNIVLFTAGVKDYVDLVLDVIDQDCLIKIVMDRRTCTKIRNKKTNRDIYVKDLHKVGFDLNRTLILDDSLNSIQMNIENGIHLDSYKGDKSDRVLSNLIEHLLFCKGLVDLREYNLKLLK